MISDRWLVDNKDIECVAGPENYKDKWKVDEEVDEYTDSVDKQEDVNDRWLVDGKEIGKRQ